MSSDLHYADAGALGNVRKHFLAGHIATILGQRMKAKVRSDA
jgi:hypothetical protein